METYNFEELSNSQYKMDRVIVAGHCNTPMSIVQKLLKDEEPEVREAAKKNLALREPFLISKETIRWLATTNIPDEIKRWLVLHPNKIVKESLSMHIDCIEDDFLL